MKCLIPRCKAEVVVSRKPRNGLLPPPLDLCGPHQNRYRKAYREHFQPMFDRLSKKRRRVVNGRPAPSRPEDVVAAWASGSSREKSWQATWLQMVDLELLNEGMGGQKGTWEKRDGVEVWVPEGSTPRPSYPGYARLPSGSLPEEAYPEGQAAIAKRNAEQRRLEQQLAADAAEYQRGRRMELELELKTKRLVEQRAAFKKAKKA